MDLTITLTQKEYDSIAGWVKYYQLHPEYIGVPPPANPPWPPNYQSRIVLDSTDRSRFDQIAAQFSGPPVGITIFDVLWGDGARHLTKDIVPFACNIIAMRFTVPPTPTSYNKPGYTSISEFQSQPTLRQASISTVAGDFGPSALVISNPGNQVTLDWSVGTPGILSLNPGGTYFINFRNWNGIECSCPTPSCNAGFSTNWPMNI